MVTDEHSCGRDKGSCSTCRPCRDKRAEHHVRLTSGHMLKVTRCGYCDGAQAHGVPAVAKRPPVRYCDGKGRGFGDHEPHVIGKAAS